MSYSFIWQPIAEYTFFEEIDFILLKWNVKEAQKFKDLVDENLLRLSKNPAIGNYKKELKIYSILISKQTTLYYDFDKNTKIIDLYVFWNNSKNPADLIKLL
nr:type II toxin-antitoxin system RelE/ParE family toxin [uncultured Flavobacterium sp.]